MADLSQTLKPGTLLVLETGEYSDYSFASPLRVLRPMLLEEVVERFKSSWVPDPNDKWRTGPDPYDFSGWLVAQGYVEAIDDVYSWHIGSYGRFEP